MLMTATPYRVSLLGGGTDYPEWFLENGGCVLGMAIDHYCYVAVKRLPPVYDGVRYRIAYARVEDRATVEEIEHPAVRGTLKHFAQDEPIEIGHMGDLPARGGMGASSSFVVGLANALRAHYYGEQSTPSALAQTAITLERDVIREAVGWQDQIFAAYGGLHFVKFNGNGYGLYSVRMSAQRRAELERSLVLVYTGTLRNAHEMAAKQIAALNDHRDDLTILADAAREGKSLLENDHSRLSEFGRLLDDAWRAKRNLCDSLTTPDIDALHDRGLALGALGGKLLGAGGGGFFLFMVEQENIAVFRERIGAPSVTFRIAERGSQIVQLPSAGDAHAGGHNG